jgi:GH15 family glucan-1,4-alpha-glucosidase
MDYKPIENYGVIGDLNTVALVGNDGSIDFMAFPHFNAPTIFAALLDRKRGGHFCISPRVEGARHKQLYLPDTNVLLTRFLFREGVAELSDFMPIHEGPKAHRLVRRIKTVKGTIHFSMRCEPGFDYGRASHRVKKSNGGVLFTSSGFNPVSIFLRTDAPIRLQDGAAVSQFTLHAGESLSFVLEEAQPLGRSLSRSDTFVSDSFKATVNFWRRWIARSNYHGRWREMVNRSALILKLLTSEPYGSIVAAPTFGLPEVIGGERNWDYRYTWIRDASFTLYALIRLGYTEEAASFMNWIEARCAELNDDGSLQIMYGIDGSREITEVELDHFEGYRGSRPVRIGNGAYDQLQLDIYGELMDSVYLYDKFGEPVSYDLWRNLTHLVDWVCKNWTRKDEGIWEVRGGKQEFLYSRLMCWVALDRAIRLSHKRSFPAPLDRWYSVRDSIYTDIMDNFWDPKRRAFVQYRGSKNLDASNLLMPLVKFIGPKDPRWLSTLCAIEHELIEDSLVFRYRINEAAADGFTGDEGTFSMCSFWYVECLSRSGDLEKARFIFEKAIGYANHLGLYAEELGPQGEHLGNFPQAFTHLGLISAAYDLDRRLARSC